MLQLQGQNDEKVPHIFPLHGEYSKPEHTQKPARKHKQATPLIQPNLAIPPKPEILVIPNDPIPILYPESHLPILL